MKTRIICSVVMFLVFALALLAVRAQSQQIGRLRSERQVLLANLSRIESSGTAEGANLLAAPDTGSGVSAELLRLRNEAARLTNLRRKLEPVLRENAGLRAQVARAATNAVGLSPGYMRKSQARFAGYASPEATVQSFLWAIHNRDTNVFLRTLAPESLRQVQITPLGVGNLLDSMQAFVGFSIVEQNSLPDGSMKLKIQVAPELPAADIAFQLVNGEWKMEMPQ